MNVFDLKEVLGVVIMAIVMIVIPMVAKPMMSYWYARAKRAWADFEKDQPKLAVYLDAFAHIAVVAAEQAGLRKDVADKKNYALDTVKAWLRQEGYEDIDPTLIDAAIEKAVMEVFNPDRLGWFSEIVEPDPVG